MVADGYLDDSLRHDFYLLNSVLASLIHVVQTEIRAVSPLLALFDQFTAQVQQFIIDHGIRAARSRAWYFAEKLIATPRPQWPQLIAEQDRHVARISERILAPAWLFRPALWIIRQQEKTNPHEIISGLSGEKWYEEAHRKVLQVIGTSGDFDAEFMKRETQLMPAVTLPIEQT